MIVFGQFWFMWMVLRAVFAQNQWILVVIFLLNRILHHLRLSRFYLVKIKMIIISHLVKNSRENSILNCISVCYFVIYGPISIPSELYSMYSIPLGCVLWGDDMPRCTRKKCIYSFMVKTRFRLFLGQSNRYCKWKICFSGWVLCCGLCSLIWA